METKYGLLEDAEKPSGVDSESCCGVEQTAYSMLARLPGLHTYGFLAFFVYFGHKAGKKMADTRGYFVAERGTVRRGRRAAPRPLAVRASRGAPRRPAPATRQAAGASSVPPYTLHIDPLCA